jgi:23S rRNA U2552 (ribose-2'-O)-methylase RlmE/FtsJ
MQSFKQLRGRATQLKDMLLGFRSGFRYGRDFSEAIRGSGQSTETNDHEKYFDDHLTGPGLWKWRHYFSIYDRHFSKFRGKEVHIVEIGVYSGGSLGMWKHYFGDKVQVYGVDIEPACRVYEGPGVHIFIGDQSDPEFWKRFVREVPKIDIVVDDGGHLPDQQIATLAGLLPHMQPGGVFLCEDVQMSFQRFHDYVDGFARNLHTMRPLRPDDSFQTTEVQRWVDSVHHYPFVTVIEKRDVPLDQMISVKHGTEWQPFLNTRLPTPPQSDN